MGIFEFTLIFTGMFFGAALVCVAVALLAFKFLGGEEE